MRIIDLGHSKKKVLFRIRFFKFKNVNNNKNVAEENIFFLNKYKKDPFFELIINSEFLI